LIVASVEECGEPFRRGGLQTKCHSIIWLSHHPPTRFGYGDALLLDDDRRNISVLYANLRIRELDVDGSGERPRRRRNPLVTPRRVGDDAPSSVVAYNDRSARAAVARPRHEPIRIAVATRQTRDRR
jgi:hypothetical protein